MSETLIQQLIAFPTNAPSANEIWSAFPQRLHELTEEEANYLTQVITESMDSLAAVVAEEAGHSLSSKVMTKHLVTPFIFAFDKGIEIVYKMLAGENEQVEFNLDDMDGESGGQIPEYIQLKVAPVTPIVAMIFDETIDFAEQEATSSLDSEELFKSILTGGMFLGVEFGLRNNMHDVT